VGQLTGARGSGADENQNEEGQCSAPHGRRKGKDRMGHRGSGVRIWEEEGKYGPSKGVASNIGPPYEKKKREKGTGLLYWWM